MVSGIKVKVRFRGGLGVVSNEHYSFGSLYGSTETCPPKPLFNLLRPPLNPKPCTEEYIADPGMNAKFFFESTRRVGMDVGRESLQERVLKKGSLGFRVYTLNPKPKSLKSL